MGQHTPGEQHPRCHILLRSILTMLVFVVVTQIPQFPVLPCPPNIAFAQSPSDIEQVDKPTNDQPRPRPIETSVNLLRLRSEDVPQYERQQAEKQSHGQVLDSLVGVLGTSRLRHVSHAKAVAWSPDGTLLASIGADNCLSIWDPDTGKELHRIKPEVDRYRGRGEVSSFAFDPAVKQVAVGLSSNQLQIWNIETHSVTQTIDITGAKRNDNILQIAWHPTRPLIATGGELNAKLWDLSTGTLVRVLGPLKQSFQRTWDNVLVSFTQDGQNVIVGHPDGSMRYWNVDDGTSRTVVEPGLPIKAMAIDPVNDRLYSRRFQCELRLGKLSTGEMIEENNNFHSTVHEVFDVRQGAIYGYDYLDRMICKWDLRTGDKLMEIKGSAQMSGCLAVHPTRDLIASGGLGVQIWDTKTGQPHIETSGHFGSIPALEFTADGTRLVSAGSDRTVRIWSLGNQSQLASYKVAQFFFAPSVAVMPDARSFATDSQVQQQFVDVRSFEDGAISHSWKIFGGETKYSVSPDGRWFAAKSTNMFGHPDEVVLRDLVKGVEHGNTDAPTGDLHFSPDGKTFFVVGEVRIAHAALEQKSRLSVWDVANFKNTFNVENIQGLVNVTASALSSDGATLALIGTGYDQDDQLHTQLVFWDTAKKATRLVIELSSQPWYFRYLMKFAPDGRSLLTVAPLDGEVKIWDPRDGTVRETISLSAGNHWSIGAVAIAPDSRHFAVGMGNGTIYLIRAKPADDDVPTRSHVPESLTGPRIDHWKELINQPAPELKAEQWMFGEATNIEQLRGRWVVLYFMPDQFGARNIPDWMDVQERFGDQQLTVIVVKRPRTSSLEERPDELEELIEKKLGGHALPLRVMIDQPEPNLIPGTKVETGGATHAAYRAITQLNSIRFIPPLALLIGPDGIVKQQIDIWPRDQVVEKLEAATGLKSAAADGKIKGGRTR